MTQYSSKYFILFLIGIVTSYAGLNIYGACIDGFTLDEPVYLSSGYSFISKGSIWLNPFHPWLVKAIAGFAISTLPLTPLPTNILVENFNAQTFYGFFLNHNLPRVYEMMITGRLAVIALNTLLALSFMLLVRKVFNPFISLILGILLLFNPTFLAHSRYVTLDASYAILVACVALASCLYAKQPSKRSWLLFTSFLFLTLNSKFQGLIVIPVILGGYVFTFWRDGTKLKTISLGAVWSVCLCVTITAIFYQFAVKSVSDSKMITYQNRLRNEGPALFHDITSTLQSIPPLRGLSWYATGLFCSMNRRNDIRRFPIILGKSTYKDGGKVRYFPTLYLVKETIGWHLFILAGLIIAISNRRQLFESSPLIRKTHRLLTIQGTLYLMAFMTLALTSNFNAGVRLVLSTYPFLLFLIAFPLQIAYHAQSSRKLIVILLFLFIHLGEVFFRYPHLIPFFNLIAGGPAQGTSWAVDSNFDWGQNTLGALAEIKKRGGDTLYGQLITSVDPYYYGGIKFIPTPIQSIQSIPKESYYAVSKTFLEYRRRANNSFDEILPQNFTLIAEIGSSILIYKVL